MSEGERSARVLREIFLASFMVGLPPENISWVAARLSRAMSELRLRPGEVLYREGDLSTDEFFVVSGEVRLEGRDTPPWILGSRSLVGAFDVMLDRPRSRTVTAIRDTHLLRVPAGEWLDMLEDNFEVTRRAMEGIGSGVHALRLELGDRETEEERPSSKVDLPARRLDLVQRVFALRNVPMFANADIQALTRLAELAREVELAQGESAFEHRGSGEALLVILSGEVTASRPEFARPVRYGPGALVFGLAVLAPTELGYDVRAVAPTRALRIGREDYFDTMEEHFPLARSALKALVIEREALLNERSRRGRPVIEGRVSVQMNPEAIPLPNDIEPRAL